MDGTGDRRFLVVGRVGKESLHRTWLGRPAAARTWDLVLNTYSDDDDFIDDGDLPFVRDKGTKWDSIVRFFQARPGLLDKYDYLMFPDDDVLMSSDDINEIFAITSDFGLTMSQPAMSYASHFSHSILLVCPHFKMRYSNFLESMACCIKTEHFRRLMPMFEKHFTGWGTDAIWALLMKHPRYQAAIIDAVQMTHTRPLYVGPIYGQLSVQGIDPQNEIDTLRHSFENTPDEFIIYGGISKRGRRTGWIETRVINGIYLLCSALRSNRKEIVARKGLAMLLRTISKYNYAPTQLRPVPGSCVSHWIEGE